MKKGFTTITIIASIGLIALVGNLLYILNEDNKNNQLLAGPTVNYQRSVIPIDSTENLGTTTAPWDELHVNEVCLSADCKTAWPTGGGSGGGTWSTTTSSVSGRLVNYPNNATDVVAIGSNSTTTSEYWFDPNVGISYLSGNVGIGSTSPLSTLTVQTTSGEIARFAGSSNSNNSYISLFDAGNQILLGTFSTGGFVGTFGSQTFNIRTSNTNRLSVTSTGNVGISSSSPYAKLSVQGMYGDTNNILFAVSSSSLTATTTLFTINNLGNVGIGSSSPSGKLQVFGSGTGNVLMGEWGGSSNYGAISLNGSLVTGNANFYSSPNETNLYINRPSGKSISFAENNGFSQMVILSGGFVGIGTSSPYARLSVVGEAVAEKFTATSTSATSTFAGFLQAARLNITGSATNTSSIGFNITSGCYAINGTCVSGGVGGSGTVNSGTTGQVAYYNANGTAVIGTSTLFIAPSGNIGIGTTSPGYALSIQGTTTPFIYLNVTDPTSYSGIRMHEDGQTAFSFLYVGSTFSETGRRNYGEFQNQIGGGFNWRTVGSGNIIERMRLTPSGNVGIGSTSPIAKLSVAGNFGDTNSLIFAVSSSTSALSTTTVFVVNNQGIVGIGTSSPYARLSVVGDVVAASYFATSTTATSTFAGGFRVTGTRGIRLDDFASCTALETNSSGDLACGVDDTTAGSGGSNWKIETNFNAIALTPTTTIPVWIKSPLYASSTAFIDSTLTVGRGATTISIASTTSYFLVNNFGIGTTSPYAKLSVVGDIVASNFTATSTTATSSFQDVTVQGKPITGFRYMRFGYSTTTTWTGTTTSQEIGLSGLPQTYDQLTCATNGGTVNVQITNNSASLNMVPASSTAATYTFSTNNAFGYFASSSIVYGTPASSPTAVNCVLRYYLNDDQ